MATVGTPEGIALITGAGSGIGKATAFHFASVGVKGITFADVSKQSAETAAEESKKYASNPQYSVLVVDVDVTSEESVQRMVDLTVDKFGRVDYGINSAGIAGNSTAPIQHLKIENFDNILAVNLKGTMLCVRAVSNQMSKQELRMSDNGGTSAPTASCSLGRGAIVNVGSTASHIAGRGITAYTASKHAVVGLTKCAALDLMPLDIRVNAVCPGWVDTPLVATAKAKEPTLVKMIEEMAPGGRMAMPEEIAATIGFLCSPGATYVNGANWIVDGGLTVTASKL